MRRLTYLTPYIRAACLTRATADMLQKSELAILAAGEFPLLKMMVGLSGART